MTAPVHVCWPLLVRHHLAVHLPGRTAPGVAPVVSVRREDDDELDHWTCCDENRALCGADDIGAWIPDGEPINCVVCIDLENTPCCEGCDW